MTLAQAAIGAFLQSPSLHGGSLNGRMNSSGRVRNLRASSFKSCGVCEKRMRRDFMVTNKVSEKLTVRLTKPKQKTLSAIVATVDPGTLNFSEAIAAPNWPLENVM
jgi:hypothetical protein